MHAGIWTKTLKARTNIHQTNINKYLKSLEGKNLIKSVKSVKHPTRKIYMLAELTPSIELSGGPWYTDNELDTEFIGYLLKGIRRCLQERVRCAGRAHMRTLLNAALSQSFPHMPNRPSAVFPACHTAYLQTTVQDVLDYLCHLGIIQPGTELSTEHISSLLEMLIYDGEVERITVGAVKTAQRTELSADGAASDSDDAGQGKRKIRAQQPRASKRRKVADDDGHGVRAASMDSDDIDNEGADAGEDLDVAQEIDVEEDLAPESAPLKPALKNHRRSEGGQTFVYRSVRPLPSDSGAGRISGIYDMPCGHCPQLTFCAEKGKAWQARARGEPERNGLGDGVAPVNPVDCIYL